MVDSHTIAAGTVTLIGVAVFIRSIAGVINATSRLIQAASRLAKIIVTFFKNPLSSALLNIFKNSPFWYLGGITTSGSCLWLSSL